MAPTVREDPKYQRIQQGAAEVDDYVLQEFLTDIIDSAPFNAAGNQTIQLLDQTKPQVFGNGNQLNLNKSNTYRVRAVRAF